MIVIVDVFFFSTKGKFDSSNLFVLLSAIPQCFAYKAILKLRIMQLEIC